MPDRPTPEPGESLTADGTSFQQIFETYYRSVFGFFVARGVGVARAVPPAEPRAVDARKSRPVFAEQVEELMDRHRAEPGRGYDVKAFEIAERARTDGLADIFGARPEPISLREIQRGLLDRDTLLLDYFPGERQSTPWVG